MEATPSAIRAAIATGETDRVNEAIDAVEDLDRETALDRFDAIREVCEERYAEGTGYQRQATVRVIDAFGTAWIPIAATVPDTEPVASTDTDAALVQEHRMACWEFLLTAIRDGDGRVRRAAIRAMNTLGVAAKLGDRDDELAAAVDALSDARAACSDPDVTEHIEEAIEQTRSHRLLFL